MIRPLCSLPVLMVVLAAGCTSGGEPTGAANPAEPGIVGGFVDVEGGLRLYYQFHGAGERTLVFLHGGPGFNFMGCGPDLLPLAQDYRLLMYDQRGGGRSDPDPQAASQLPVMHVQDLETVRQTLGIERMTLIGHSWGSILAALYTARYPERVEQLVLIGPMEPSERMLTERLAAEEPIQQQAQEKLALLADREDLQADPLARCRAEIETLQGFYYHDPSKMQKKKGDYCNAPADGVERMQVISKSIVDALAGYDLQPTLETMQVRALVIEGAQSPLPEAGSVAWARALPNARLWWIDQVGHAYPFVEAPETFFKGVKEFLSGGWPEAAEVVE